MSAAFGFSFAKKMQTSAMKVLLSNCRVQVFLLQRYNKKQLFAIVCSDFVLKSAHIFNIYTENQVVTKPLNISHLKKESVSFLSKSFLSFSKNKNTFHLYKEYIYKYIFIYIFFIELFFYFQNRKWQKWLWQKWQDSDKLIFSKTILHFNNIATYRILSTIHNKKIIPSVRFYA